MGSDFTGPGSVGAMVLERSLSKRAIVAADEVNRIVAVAFDVIAESQTTELSLREVLRRSGLSTATFYRHFRSSDELLLVLLDQGSLILSSYLAHRMNAEDQPVARIAAWVEAYLHQAEDPVAASRTRPFAVGAYRVESEFPHEHRRMQKRLVDPLVTEIHAGNQDETCNSPDPSRDAWAIFDCTSSLMLRHVVERTKPSPDDVDHRVGLALRIIGAHHR